MATYELYYATNRKHIGNRWKPDGYGTKFSDDGIENLRFGWLTVEADDKEVKKFINADKKDGGIGDGEKLAEYLSKCAKKANITAYEESIKATIADVAQSTAKFGSLAMFEDIMADMENSTDVLVYIHGFNVAWNEAVGYAIALQLMMQNAQTRDKNQDLRVVLFSWPSDGMALPWVSYKSDRTEAAGSGAAMGRAFLKLRDFLVELRDRAKKGGRKLCGQDIHLLCHSMGNFVLQNAIPRIADFTPGNNLPRIFEHIFLCAPDVDDMVFEANQPFYNLDQFTRNVTIYHNREDKAMVVSDYTKGNPERLGGSGAARPMNLHNKVHQVDCTPIVHGIVEHSYYLMGHIANDIRMSIDGLTQEDNQRRRKQSGMLNNVWEMK